MRYKGREGECRTSARCRSAGSRSLYRQRLARLIDDDIKFGGEGPTSDVTSGHRPWLDLASNKRVESSNPLVVDGWWRVGS